MSMGVPSVVTDLVADGLRTPTGDQPPLVIADDDTAFAAAIVAALHRATADPRPDDAARAYVTAHFSWQRSGADLAALIESAVGDPAREARP
jgi:glycosyltransferase involved in cell wall biosynthesis